METPDWLLLVSRDGVVEAVDGGAPRAWISRRIDACPGLPDAVRSAARKLVRDLSQPLSNTLLRRIRVEPPDPESPSVTLLAVEAILLRPDEVAFAPLLRQALEPLAHQAEGMGVSLHVASDADLPARVSLDGSKIVWAVTTLVGNALRYLRRGGSTLPGGHVGVALGHNPGQRMVSITVEDDGPGISAEVQARLLGDDAGKATGVSLRLVHEVVAAHGGGMVIKSSTAPENRGTAVTLWLPVRG